MLWLRSFIRRAVRVYIWRGLCGSCRKSQIESGTPAFLKAGAAISLIDRRAHTLANKVTPA
jgi:hypothetical protein